MYEEITCPDCKIEFEAQVCIDGECPKCQKTYTWDSIGLIEEWVYPDWLLTRYINCPYCKEFFKVEERVDGSCVCGQDYFWDEWSDKTGKIWLQIEW